MYPAGLALLLTFRLVFSLAVFTDYQLINSEKYHNNITRFALLLSLPARCHLRSYEVRSKHEPNWYVLQNCGYIWSNGNCKFPTIG